MESNDRGMNPDKTSLNQEQAEGAATQLEDIEQLKRICSEEKAKATEYLSGWQRAQADLANYRKRVEQEREDNVKSANSGLVLDLLAVLDDLELAIDNAPEESAGKPWMEGVKLIYRKLQGVLQRYGLSEIKALGQPFDPHYHEAVLRGEGKEGVVIQVLKKGYKMHDRVLRPAMVKVGAGEEVSGQEQ